MNASKERFGAADLDTVFSGVSKVVVAKGKKVMTFDLKKQDTSDPEFQKAVLGPTGNLRAPTLKTGKTALVGFHPEAYDARFTS